MTEAPPPAGTASSNLLTMLGSGFLTNPYPAYANLQSSSPVLWAPGVFGIGAWIATSHAICSSVLRDKRFIKEGQRVLSPEKMAMIPLEGNADLMERRRSNMLFRDPPDHTRLRGLVNQAFTPRQVDRLRPHIASIAESLINDMASKGSGDLLRDFAFPLPIIVIAELLGVPPEHRDQFKIWSSDLTLGLSPLLTNDDLAKVRRAIEPMDEYIGGIVEARRREPRQDLISELVRVQNAGDRLSMNELLATCRLLLTAGHETTVNLIGNGSLALLRNPEQRAMLAADESLLANAVEELLRYDSPVQLTMRFASEDAPLGNQAAKRGDLVVLLLGAANRDPAHFSNPQELDIRRENAGTHLSLGQGIHYCLGAPLARLEGELAIGALLRRLPRLALAEGELEWRPNIVLRGLKSLPVTF